MMSARKTQVEVRLGFLIKFCVTVWKCADGNEAGLVRMRDQISSGRMVKGFVGSGRDSVVAMLVSGTPVEIIFVRFVGLLLGGHS